MESLKVEVFTRSCDVPEMEQKNFFHSKSLFQLYEQTPGHTPLMVVVNCKDHTLCHLLAIIRRRSSWVPPYLYGQCRIYGEGEYTECEYRKEDLFLKMLTALTKKVQQRCLYIEFSNIGPKMFGYKYFRRCNYFPVHWMEIHNSLHSKTPEERVTKKTMARIEASLGNGVEISTVETKTERNSCIRLIRKYYKSKLRSYCPPAKFFELLNDSGHGQLFITKYHGRIIGGSACTYSDGNAYLWYVAYRKKSYPHLHPDIMSVWTAIKHAEKIGCRHIYFIDVGLPFRKNPYRDFILKFGGKPVSTNRWFRFSIRWINSILSWFYR